jgi:hypothetical protein
MARRPRVDSIAAAKTIAAMAGKPIDPPKHVPLAAADMPFWQSVIAEFARAEWTAHQLEVAAMLARYMSREVVNHQALIDEGEVLISEKGTPVANPRLQAMRMYSANITAYRRTLQIHARAQGGEARDVGKRKAQAQEIETGVMGDDGDGLLASRH